MQFLSNVQINCNIAADGKYEARCRSRESVHSHSFPSGQPKRVRRVERARKRPQGGEKAVLPTQCDRGLRTSSTRSVGVLVLQLAHPFFAAIAIAAEKHLFVHGYRIFLCSSEDDPDKESAYIDMLLSQRIDGVILLSTGTSEPDAKRLLDAKIPMVVVDRDLPQVEVDRVLADNYRGAQEGIVQAGLEFDGKLEVVIEKPGFEMAVAAGRKLLKRAHPPTVIMAENELLAVGVLNGALRAGLHIPDDLSVTGFDDVSWPLISIRN